MRVGEKRYRVTLDGGNHFYLAAIWEPAMGEWPVSYCIITVPANPEVAQHQERHGAVIHRRQVMQWLDLTVPETDRSEEHTSELQSLMRISYAVFCLKKKKQTNTKKLHKYTKNT